MPFPVYMGVGNKSKKFNERLDEVTKRKEKQQKQENVWEERKLGMEEALNKPKAEILQEESDRFRSGLDRLLWRTNLLTDINVAQVKKRYAQSPEFAARFKNERELDALLNLAAMGRAIADTDASIKGGQLGKDAYGKIGYDRQAPSTVVPETEKTQTPESNTKGPDDRYRLRTPESAPPKMDPTKPFGGMDYVAPGSQEPWPRQGPIEPKMYTPGKPALPPSIAPPGNVGPYGHSWHPDLYDPYGKKRKTDEEE